MATINIKEFFIRLNRIDAWLAITGILASVLFVMIILFFYVEWKKPLLQQALDQKQTELSNFSKSLIEKSKNTDHQKYKIAKIIEKQSIPLVRESTIKELVMMFDQLQGRFSTDELTINDFQINIDKVSVRGSVINLQTVYGSNGLLDTFAKLSFVENIDIPFYKKYGGRYEFLLEAKIKTSKKE